MPRNLHLQALDDAISNTSLPRSSGTLEITAEESVIFYGWDEDTEDHVQTARRLTVLDAPDDALKGLADACTPASFGRLQEAVLDETYRKAGKLDTTQFHATFDVEKSGLVDRVRSFLLEGLNQDIGLRIELYKLNVYGPGSFFKAHRDTPRGTNMFASLVVVYLTDHEGGALLFRHQGKEFWFDSATEIQQAEVPSMAFLAFYSDMEHEVEPVTSGYRVTLTYNIYAEKVDDPQKFIVDRTPCELDLKAAFRSLLVDTDFLPKGGVVGFGFRHDYPGRWHLKGTDAILDQVCDKLGLVTRFKNLYETEWDQESIVIVCNIDDVAYDYAMYEHDSVGEHILRERLGKAVIDGDETAVNGVRPNDYVPWTSDDDDDSAVLIYWATPKFAIGVHGTREAYASYGNEPSLAHIYRHGYLLVTIPDAASRLEKWGKKLENAEIEGKVEETGMDKGKGKDQKEGDDATLDGVESVRA